VLPAPDTRAVTARLLARELGVDAADLKISRVCTHCGDPAHGRPHLVGGERSFNLSHSGDRFVLAIGDPALQLGVDVEVVRPRARLDALARRTLDATAYERWLSAPDAEPLVTFLRAWTAKEAYLKAVGLGIATSLREVPAAPPGFTFYPVDGWPDAVVTVAVDTADAEVVVQAE